MAFWRRQVAVALGALVLTLAGLLPPAVADAAVGEVAAAARGVVMPGPVAPPPRLSARAAVLMDWQTGQVLLDKNAHVTRPPASTTKVLTAILALEHGRLTDRVTISRRAAGTPGSSMYLRAGEVYTLHDLLKGLLVRSGNDAAVAIAEHIGGSVEGFAQMMNAKARAIGARKSRFVNPHGLHKPGHYSTAYDLALITRYALRYPIFADLVRQREVAVGSGASARVLSNTNRLLWTFQGADGVKTGTTSAAGECLISSATRPEPETELDWKLIAVVLDADARWQDSMQLLEWGFANYRLVRLAGPGDGLAELPVVAGREPRVTAAAADYVAAVVPRKAEGAPELIFAVPEQVAAPVVAGTPLGVVRVRWDGRVQREVALVAAGAVPRATWATWMVRPLLPWLRWLGRQGWM